MGAKRDWQLLQKSVGDSLGFVSVTILRCVSDLSGTEQIGQTSFLRILSFISLMYLHSEILSPREHFPQFHFIHDLL